VQGGVASEAHFPAWDLTRLRIFGVLQRIAVCFLFVSLLILYVPESALPKLEVQCFPCLPRPVPESWLVKTVCPV